MKLEEAGQSMIGMGCGLMILGLAVPFIGLAALMVLYLAKGCFGG